ncbi:MAG: hypothetical protein JWO87_2457 [Phycisphaerales bacterium]|jgi:hypothetical protein|nr:hypothetical protein [Phycisphaerales bacterium]MDB5300794.1 hypothetical protein [Phycisphaerales bacterium]
MCEIEFHCTNSAFAVAPRPYPASRHVSEWFKEMPLDRGDQGTLKRCPPYLAAMTAGYIIPAPVDLRFGMSAEGVLTAQGDVNLLGRHLQKQVEGSPFSGSPIVKFMNPWIIVTPPEFVCLITAPINRYESPFLPLTGIVETGTYYREVHLPMACLLRPGQTFELKAGTPLIQVIPMRRDQWTSRAAIMDDALRARHQEMFDTNRHAYKDEFWKRIHFD